MPLDAARVEFALPLGSDLIDAPPGPAPAVRLGFAVAQAIGHPHWLVDEWIDRAWEAIMMQY